MPIQIFGPMIASYPDFRDQKKFQVLRCKFVKILQKSRAALAKETSRQPVPVRYRDLFAVETSRGNQRYLVDLW